MPTTSNLVQKGLDRATVLSPSRKYRYCLWRSWGESVGRYVVFIGLNPSTADESVDDPTVRRCVGFARRWGFESLCMLNLFAFRATRPTDLFKAKDPIGPINDDFLRDLSRGASRVVACWGVHGAFQDRAAYVSQWVQGAKCLGLTKDGAPRHPLYVPYEARLRLFRRAAV